MGATAARRYVAARLALDHWLKITESHGSLIRALTGDGAIHAQVHYPELDLIDSYSGTQCYYHCHRGGDEHGHLHLFRRPTAAGHLTHLIAISLDSRGLPVALFTVNRWVSDDHWLPAEDILSLLEGVSLRRSGCPTDLALWLFHFLHFYHTLIQQLLWQRDQRLLTAGVSLDQHLNDRDLEVLSFSTIDWSADLAEVEAQVHLVTKAEMAT